MAKAKQKTPKQEDSPDEDLGNIPSTATRSATFEVEGARADGGIPVVISSDAPIEMRDFTEVLVHSDDAIDLTRAPLPIIDGHRNVDHVSVGIVDDLKVTDGVLRGVAIFGKRQEAREYESDVRSRIIRSVSAGYVRIKARVRNDGVLVTSKWMPMHVAMVAQPADAMAGFYRSKDSVPALDVEREEVSQPAASAITKGVDMTTEKQAAAAVPAGEGARVTDNYDPVAAQAKRAEGIRNMAKGMEIHDERAIQMWIASGKDSDTLASEMLKVKAERSAQAALQVASIGLTDREAKQFSVVRAINAVINKDWSKAGFEARVSQATAQKVGKYLNEHTFAIPAEVQNLAARVLIAGTAAQGGYTVGTDIVSFIDVLRNRSVAFQAGVTVMGGLVGQVAIPKKTTAGSFAWLAETGTATASEMVLSQVTMSPKKLSGYQEYSKQLMLQSTPDVETLVLNDLADGIAVKVDATILLGTGADNPLGIRFTTGLGTANPTAGTAVVNSDMIRFQTTVAAANALFPNFTYITTPAVAGILMAKQYWGTGASDRAIWDGGLLNGTVVGQRAWSTVQMTAGVMLAGDFSQAIFGQWSGMEIEVNPYANFQADIVGVKGTLYADVAVRYPGAFAVGTGMTG